MLAKIVDGTLVVQPTNVTYDDFIIFNPSEKILKELGYKNYVDPGYTFEEGRTYEPSYMETEDSITVTWS